MSQLEICEGDLTDQKVADLLQEHLEHMQELSPPESVHALDLGAFRSLNITLWTAWEGDELLGCGALKELDSNSGEVKSMRTANAHRRKGVAAKILEHLIQEARRRGYDRLNLETGASADFAPAQALYIRYGFTYRDPFADYVDDPNSVFMTKQL